MALVLAVLGSACLASSVHGTREQIPGLQYIKHMSLQKTSGHAPAVPKCTSPGRLPVLLLALTGVPTGWQVSGGSVKNPRPRSTQEKTHVSLSVANIVEPSQVQVEVASNTDSLQGPAEMETPASSAAPVHKIAEVLQTYVQDVTTPKAFASSLIAGSGNVAAQLSSTHWHIEDVALVQVLSYALFTLLYSNGLQPHVYRAMDRQFGDNLWYKMLTEFLLYGPFVYLPAFYIITGMLQGIGLSASLEKLSFFWSDTYLAYLAVWPLPMLVYFRWVPEDMRVIFLPCFGFIEKVVYTLVGNKG